MVKVSPTGVIYTDESTLQRFCVNWFRTVYAPLAKFLFSIPNGGKLGGKKNKKGFSIQAAIMVGEGMTAGVADLFLAIPKCGLHGLFIEIKTPVGTWEQDQKEFAERQLGQGYGYILCRRFEDLEADVNAYLANTFLQPPFQEIDKRSKLFLKTVARVTVK